MRIKFRKKAVIIGIVIIMYIAALPLALHFTGAFKKPEKPDLKTLTGSDIVYAKKTDDEKLSLLENIGFDLKAFSDNGFMFELSQIMVYIFQDTPDKVCYLSMTTQDNDTYFYIKLTIFMPDAEKQATMIGNPNYERREVDGKAVGFYEPGDGIPGDSRARYHDEQGGCVYYVEPALDFSAVENEFLAMLVSVKSSVLKASNFL